MESNNQKKEREIEKVKDKKRDNKAKRPINEVSESKQMPSQDKWDCIKQLSAVAQVNVKRERKVESSRQPTQLKKHLFKPSGKNHMHGLIFELKERMNSRQDQPVIKTNQKRLEIKTEGLILQLKKDKKRKSTIVHWCDFSLFHQRLKEKKACLINSWMLSHKDLTKSKRDGKKREYE